MNFTWKDWVFWLVNLEFAYFAANVATNKATPLTVILMTAWIPVCVYGWNLILKENPENDSLEVS